MNSQPVTVPTMLLGLPDGERGTRETLKLMRDLVRNSKKDPLIRHFAASLVGGCRPKDWRCEIETLYCWVLENIRYVKDINGVETLADAKAIIDNGYGDCDDKSVLLATFLECIGHPTRFVAYGRRAGNYAHVMVETLMGRNWISLDATEERGVGWFPTDMPYRMLMHI